MYYNESRMERRLAEKLALYPTIIQQRETDFTEEERKKKKRSVTRNC